MVPLLLAERRLAWGYICGNANDQCTNIPIEIVDVICAHTTVEWVFRHRCVCSYLALWCECCKETASILRQLRPTNGSIIIGTGLLRAEA